MSLRRIQPDANRELRLDPNQRVVDLVVEAYVAWREACMEVSETYAELVDAPATLRDAAFALHRDSLDREERAAEEYRRQLERLSSTRTGGLAA